MKVGADKGYEFRGWEKISTRDHINHALGHLLGFLDGHTGEDHLGAAVVRIMMAYETNLINGLEEE
jgi:hypothetical protein